MNVLSRPLNERGAVGGLEGLAFGVLIFVFGTLMVTNAWVVVDAKLATTAAARESVRAYVESGDEAGARAASNVAAQRTIDGLEFVGEVSVVTNATFVRCNEVTTTATLQVPQISLPLIRGAGGTRQVSSSHTEIVDPYRSGLEGTAQC